MDCCPTNNCYKCSSKPGLTVVQKNVTAGGGPYKVNADVPSPNKVTVTDSASNLSFVLDFGRISFTNLTMSQICDLMSVLDFAQLTAEQKDAILSCLDFTQLSPGQVSSLVKNLDFTQLTDVQKSTLLSLLDFTTLSVDQINSLTQQLNFSQLTPQQKADLAFNVDPCGGAPITVAPGDTLVLKGGEGVICGNVDGAVVSNLGFDTLDTKAVVEVCDRFAIYDCSTDTHRQVSMGELLATLTSELGGDNVATANSVNSTPGSAKVHDLRGSNLSLVGVIDGNWTGSGDLTLDFAEVQITSLVRDATGVHMMGQVANPGARVSQAVADSTLWINSANGHVHRGPVDLESPSASAIQVNTGTGVADLQTAMDRLNALVDGLVNSRSFSDDASAAVGGLTSGDIYVTNGLGAAPLNVAGIVMLKQ